MTEIELTPVEAALRQGFRTFNRCMLLMWRLGLGPMLNFWPVALGRYMIIVHRGRKTGLLRYTPVNYASIDGDIYCTAGFGPVSDWYRNMQANPDVELWLPDGRWSAHATDVSDADNRLALMRQVLVGSGFAAPLAGVDPHALSDEALAKASVNYRLVRFERREPVVGPGGPGDLMWLWPLIVLFMLPLTLRRGRRRR